MKHGRLSPDPLIATSLRAGGYSDTKRTKQGRLFVSKHGLSCADSRKSTESITWKPTPVAKLVSIRVLFAIAASLDLEIHQMDVVSAFLGSKLDEKIYMEFPDGFKNGDKVGLLGKSIYGLKQSARYFNRRFHDHLLHLGFAQTIADPCVYVNVDTGIIIAIWVDDILLFGASIDTINAVKKALAEKFNMKDVGELTFFLGIQVNRDRADKTITIRQDGYVNMILKKFQMLDAKPASIPIPHGVKLIKLDKQEESTIDGKIYQSKVGSLMYAMLCTRPDLAYAVSQISQFNNHPSEEHDAASNRVFKYLRGTSNLGITFDGKVGLEMRAYSDANWGGEVDRKSVGGYLFCLAGGAVSWTTKKQPTVALSSTESEYMALTQAAKESIWIQRLIEELGIPIANVNVIYADNQGSIALAKNPEYHACTKHIDIQHHFVRECIENSRVILQYVPTNEMAADAMTKGLTCDRLQYPSSLMGLHCGDVKKWEC